MKIRCCRKNKNTRWCCIWLSFFPLFLSTYIDLYVFTKAANNTPGLITERISFKSILLYNIKFLEMDKRKKLFTNYLHNSTFQRWEIFSVLCFLKKKDNVSRNRNRFWHWVFCFSDILEQRRKYLPRKFF